MVMQPNVGLRVIVESALPFDERRLRAAIDSSDELDTAAAVAGAFAAAAKHRFGLAGGQQESSEFSRTVSRSDYLLEPAPVWVVEAAIHGALGITDATQGISPEQLFFVYFAALHEFTKSEDESSALGNLVEQAVSIAVGMRATLGSASALEGIGDSS